MKYLIQIFAMLLIAGIPMARAATPTIALTSPSSAASQTENTSISLTGTATSSNKLVNVVWVNQFGARGKGAVLGTEGWSAADIPLRLGLNLITVTVVDAANHSASVNLAVNRLATSATPAPQAPKIGSGFLQNQPIVYQIWNGLPVAEGDILLSSVTLTAANPKTAALGSAGSKTIQPDGLGVSYTAQLWPVVNRVHQVPYVVTAGTACTGTGSSAALTAAISAFNGAAFNSTSPGVIQFVPYTNQAHYVNICVEPGGSTEGYSYVGVVTPNPAGGQLLACGSGCNQATWMHEMGHTVGLYHEHQRPDRGNYITLNLTDADLPLVPGNFTLFSFDYQTFGLYDYASVMHYGPFGFSKAGLPVLESIPAGIPLSNATGYSAGDVDSIERLYGATPAQVTVVTNPVGLSIIVDGTTYTAPQTFNFAVGSTHTLNVPADPQLTNPADGSTYAFGNWNDLGARSHTITIQGGSGTLTSPASEPAVTMYEANFIRLQPFAWLSPAVYPSGAGSVVVSPSPISEYGGTFFTDRTLVTLTLTGNAGYNFYDWFNLPYPPSDNPHNFYIQAPYTQAQAVYVTTPVTIVGESLTGPNTWNPGMAGTVDGNFTYLPSAFSSYYNGSTWNAGTTHTVAVGQTQSPVTTNVYYNFNSWSDAGAISHSITQPASGTQSIAASFTPFYASYTVPPPLGSTNASCAGGVSTSPAGTVYALNGSFDFYGDGTSVTTTATPNSTYPGFMFAGWSGGTGSLAGTTNPQAITIHDQFVPTANFNLTATPITVTSLSPASAVVSSTAAPAITINGTGFTPTDTYTYWNFNSRSNTYVSPTQLTMQLSAGDLANAGGQDVYVGNYYTNASNNTCGVAAETSFTVGVTAPSGDGAAATFVGKDTSTQGTWTGSYGSDGYLIANDATNSPSYAAVTLSGDSLYTWTASTTDPRALQTTSGSSARIASTFYSFTTYAVNVNVTDGKTHRIALYLLDWDSAGRSETISILDASNNAVLSTQTFSGFQNGAYVSWDISGHVLIQVTLTGGANAVVSGIFFDPTSSAKYVLTDTATQGTWTGSYGEDGLLIANGASNAPSYAAVTLTGDAAYTWAASTTDPRALQTASNGSSRIASTFYSFTSFTINVNITDGNTHQVGLYLLDWDGAGRSESITILDAGTNAVLYSGSYSGFQNGEYAVWNIHGHVLIQVTVTGGPNAVVSGIFFGAPPIPAAKYVDLDTTTQGTWTGKYGANGYLIANDAFDPPSYAAVALSGDSTYTWAASSTDPRALQTASGASTRIASTYYSFSNFSYNVNLFDGAVHQIALYLLDWDSGGRSETISILDANTNAVLDTRTISGFQTGDYAVWTVQGHVIIQVTVAGGANAVVSGVFFDP
ncbi:MAG: M12 family metallopeptidase [Steroidobacteraceae bacterium]